eukprot:m.150760 g.150760  ORF g.150760 m.150760 type:complete len:1372 (+) comp23324_c0_seq4:577-4692(+)
MEKWTGRTPQNLLYDLCRQNKWFKPNFQVDSIGGFVGGTACTCKVRVKREDPKSKEVLSVLAWDKERVYVDAFQARNYGAVLALHRANWDKPMHRVIPPGYREYWYDLEEERKEQVDAKKKKGHEVLTAPDPFKVTQAAREHARAVEKSQKDRDRRMKQGNRELPNVRISEKLRLLVEEAADAVGSAAGEKAADSEGGVDGAADPDLVASVMRLGFRKEHVEEALKYVDDETNALDWLCIHVPEGDLPQKFRPQVIQIEGSAHTPESLALEYKVRRIAERGFGAKETRLALDGVGGDETTALLRLAEAVCKPDEPVNLGDAATTDVSEEELTDLRAEEVEALEAIFGAAAATVTADGYTIHKVTVRREKQRPVFSVEVIIPHASRYPFALPGIVVSSTELPVYICHTAMRQLHTAAVTAVGEPMVYELVNWLKEAMPELVKKPPPLTALKPYVSLQPTLKASTAAPASKQQAERSGGRSSSKKQQHGGGGNRRQPRRNRLSDANVLVEKHRKVLASAKYRTMRKTRDKLPAGGFRAKIVETINGNQVTVIGGETGCGKTTQVPQFVLEDLLCSEGTARCKMLCTQPRRLAAIGVATRVAAERGERVGDTIGYSIRLETKQCDDTQLLFCTTGILLRMLQGDTELTSITHVFVDEVHERSVDSDIALAILRDVLSRRPDLKLILMSATLDATLFSDYFGGCPVLEIPGFTHPVKDFFLDEIVDMTDLKLRGPKKGKGGGGYGGGGGGYRGNNGGGDDDAATPPPDWVKPRPPKTAAAPTAHRDGPADDWEDGSGDDNDSGAGTATGFAAGVVVRKDEQDESEFSEEHNATIKALESRSGEVNTELLTLLVSHIIDNEGEGAILIFVAGVADISRCVRALEGVSARERIQAMPLHASLTPEQQQAIFRHAPHGVRKVVVATNVAETSITVDDVTHVIDTGRVKELQYDAAGGMSCLVETWVSQASARQRRGRAGRTRPGKCYKLYREGRWSRFALQQDAEILRVPLEQLCLKVLVMGRDLRKYMRSLLSAPDTVSIEAAVAALKGLAAIDSKEQVTALGKHLTDLPIDLRLGKFLIFASILGCLESAATIAACMSYRSFFLSPPTARDEATRAHYKFATAKSDHLTMLSAYTAWLDAKSSGGRGAEMQFCTDNFLSKFTLYQVLELRKQFLTALGDCGFGTGRSKGGPTSVADADKEELRLKAALCAGLYPRVCKVVLPATRYHQVESGAIANENSAVEIKFFGKEKGDRCFLHPSSINYRENKYESPFVIFHEKVKTTKVYLRDSTVVSPFPLLFFGGELSVDHASGIVTVDGWLQMKAPARIAVLINQLRKGVDRCLETKIVDPNTDIQGTKVRPRFHSTSFLVLYKLRFV